MSQLAADTFARTNQSGFGTASDGNTWAIMLGTATLSIKSNEGHATGATSTTKVVLGASSGDMNVLVRFRSSAVTDNVGIAVRSQDGNTHYACTVIGASTLRLAKTVAGTFTQLAVATVTYTANTYYWMRVQIAGSTLTGTLWADGGSEPGSWTITATDSSITSTGVAGLIMTLHATGDTADFDHFTAATLVSSATLDLSARAGLKNITVTQDLSARARLTATAQRDLVCRVNFLVQTVRKDLVCRVTLAGLTLSDLRGRANLSESVDDLPPFVPNTLSVMVGDQGPLPVIETTPQYAETIDGRSTCQFTVRDDTGSLHFGYRMRVVLTHSVRGAIFTGFVTTAQESNLLPNTTNLIAVTCIDEHWIPDKRAYEGPDFANRNAGDIAVALAQTLADDGVTASYALDYDTTTADFAQGTLVGVIADQGTGTSATTGDGDLELTPAGLTLTISENSQADFARGTLSGLTAANDQALELSMSQAVMLTGTAAASIGGNLYAYVQLWLGGVTLSSGDFLAYDVWIASTSPSITGGPDIVCSDGTTLRDSGALDQYQMSCHPNADLSGFANDQWFHRTITIPAAMVGKSVMLGLIAQEGDAAGTYTCYVRHMKLFNSSGGVKTTFFENGLPWGVQLLQHTGYYNITAQMVHVFEEQGQRLSPAYSLAAAGMPRASLISWQETQPVQPAGSNQSGSVTATPVLVEASCDGGATWAPCANNQPLPCLLPGMNLAGASLILRETLTQNGPSPQITPQLMNVQVTVQPSYACSGKLDITDWDSPASGLSQGTLTNLTTTASGNQIAGAYHTWDDADVTTGQTLFGAGSPGGPAVSCWERSIALRTDTGSDVRVRFDFAGSWQNFVAEIDILMPSSPTGLDMGLVYRTTGWSNTNDSYAYLARISPISIDLLKGSNGGGDTPTTLATTGLTLTGGNWYHLKVAVSGGTHQISLNNVLYLTVSDSTYTGGGQFGVRLGNTSGVRNSGFFDTFGVMTGTFAGVRVHPPLDLSSAFAVTNSLLTWNAQIPTGCTFAVDASLDGGASWAPCTNGQPVPGLEPGSALATDGVSLLVRETYTTTSAATTPLLQGIGVTVIGLYLAQGTRVSPPLPLAPVNRVGSSLIAWDATLPALTTLGIDVSLDGHTWTDVSTGSGLPLPLITSQGDTYIDDFSSDRSAAYTSGAIVTSIPSTPTSAPLTNTPAPSFKSMALSLLPSVYYRLDEVSGLVASDMTPAQNDGILAGSITYSQPGALTGDSDPAMLFGAGASLTLPYTVTPFTWSALSVAFWFKGSADWHFIVLTTNNGTGGGINAYRDGVVSSTGGSGIDPIYLSSDFSTLSLSGASTLDEVLFFPSELTPTEIQQLYSAGIGGTALSPMSLMAGTGGTGETGLPANWTVDTTNKRIVATGGIHALYSPNGVVMGDGMLIFDTDSADFGGCMWALSSDFSSGYELSVQDGSSSRLPGNVMRLFKVTGGAYAQLGRGVALSFQRGVPARFRVEQDEGVITVSVSYPIHGADGLSVIGGNTQTLTRTDPTPLPPGGIALRSNGGTQHYSLLRAVSYGDDVTNMTLYTRQRLLSADPVSTPQLNDFTVSVHGSTIGDGALIPTTTYSTLNGSTNSIAQDLDDLAKQSVYWWRILRGELNFQPTNGVPAPFVVTGRDMLYGSNVQVTYNSDLYRNESIVIGGTDVLPRTSNHRADGLTLFFDTAYDIDSIDSVLINGQAQTYGIQGVDAGKSWYYQQGKVGITQAAGVDPLPDGVQVQINYQGQVQVIAKARNEGQVALLASIDGTSGVVTVVENASGLDSAGAQALAQSRIAQYARFSIDITFETCRPGLHIGQLLRIILSQHSLNADFLVTAVSYSEAASTINSTPSLLEYFKVTATTGPVLGSWIRMFA